MIADVRIGYMTHDGWTDTTPDLVSRADAPAAMARLQLECPRALVWATIATTGEFVGALLRDGSATAEFPTAAYDRIGYDAAGTSIHGPAVRVDHGTPGIEYRALRGCGATVAAMADGRCVGWSVLP